MYCVFPAVPRVPVPHTKITHYLDFSLSPPLTSSMFIFPYYQAWVCCTWAKASAWRQCSRLCAPSNTHVAGKIPCHVFHMCSFYFMCGVLGFSDMDHPRNSVCRCLKVFRNLPLLYCYFYIFIRYAEVTLETCAYAGTGNVLKVIVFYKYCILGLKLLFSFSATSAPTIKFITLLCAILSSLHCSSGPVDVASVHRPLDRERGAPGCGCAGHRPHQHWYVF